MPALLDDRGVLRGDTDPLCTDLTSQVLDVILEQLGLLGRDLRVQALDTALFVDGILAQMEAVSFQLTSSRLSAMLSRYVLV